MIYARNTTKRSLVGISCQKHVEMEQNQDFASNHMDLRFVAPNVLDGMESGFREQPYGSSFCCDKRVGWDGIKILRDNEGL